MTQVTVPVVKQTAGLVVLETRQEMVAKYKKRIANCVAEARPNRPFPLLLSNFGKINRFFPNGMVVALACKHPLALVPLGGAVGR